MRSNCFRSLFPASRGIIRERLYLFGIGMVALNMLWRIVRYSLHYPLWPDEAKVAMNFVGATFSNLADPAQHNYVQIIPLFFWWIQLGMTKIAGLSDLSLRFLPFVAGICGMILFYRLSTKLLPPREALLAVAMFAASYYPVRHATEVKPYSFDLLASVIILSLGFEIFKERSSIRKWLAFALTGGLALWCSYTSVFVAGGVMVALLPFVLRSREPREIKLWVGAGFFLSASFALSLALFTLPMKSMGVAYFPGWAPAFPPVERPWAIPWWLLTIHSGTMLAYPIGGKNFGSSLTLILVVTGAVILWRRNRFEAWLLLAPAALSLLAAFLRFYPYGDSDRTNQHLVPTICLLGGIGLLGILKKSFKVRRIPSAIAFAVAVFAVIAISGIVHGAVKPYFAKQDVSRRDAILEIVGLTKPNDTWVIANGFRHVKPSLNGYQPISHSSIEFYLHVFAPCPVFWDDSAKPSPRPGTTIWLLLHSLPPIYGLGQEALDTLLESFTGRFGAPSVKKWQIDTNEKIEAFVFHVHQ